MRRCSLNRWIVASAAIGMVLSACNEILDNDPRTWDPDAGEQAGAPASGGALEPARGGSGGKAGTGGRGGASGGLGGSTSGRDGTAGGGSGGAATGEAGESGAISAGGEVGSAGAGGADDAGGVAGSRTCECVPGNTEMNVEACGDCMTGMRAQTKTCAEDCTWGPFGEFGECTGVTALCSPGTPGSQTVACPCGGTKSQSRSCTAACEWSGWSDTSRCDLECCSEIVFCDTPDDISPASRGTWCREKQGASCSNDEVNADCHVDVSEVCDSLVPDLYVQYL